MEHDPEAFAELLDNHGGHLAALVRPHLIDTAADVKQSMRDLVRRRSDKTHDSIEISTPPLDGDDLVAREIGPTHFVARFLERGTSREAPHPFVKPASDEHEQPFVDGCGDLIEAALNA